MIKGFYPKQKAFVKIQNGNNVVKTSERDLKQEQEWHAQMLNAGFQYNSTHDFYYSADGALMSDSQISIESLLTYPAFDGCKELGYEIDYGFPTPFGLAQGNKRAIYCKNYKEIVSKHRTTEQGQKEIEEEQKNIEMFYNGINENSSKFRR